MSRELVVLVGLLLFGAYFGFRTAQASGRRSKIYGSHPVARFFHYVACGILASVTPFVLSSVFVLHLPLLQAVLTAVSFFAVALVMLIPFAFFEKPYVEEAKRAKDRGWTAQDAKTSGL
jgi:hypothetical protein